MVYNNLMSRWGGVQIYKLRISFIIYVVEIMAASDTNVHHEHESSISIPINSEIYENSTSDFIDYILTFNDGSRISQRRVEMKVKNKETHILSLYGNHFYPIRRTESTETTIKLIEFTGLLPEKCIERKIVSMKDGVRLSLDYEITEHGAKYSANAEIEYGADIGYEDLITKEIILMKSMEAYWKYIDYSNINTTRIFSCTVRKLDLWHTLDRTKPFKWACKWNGMKARAVFKSDNTSTLWKDASDVENYDYNDDRLSILHNLCLQLEEMEDCYVIVEIIAAYYMGDMYILEPHTNIQMLDIIRNEFSHRKEDADIRPPLMVYGKRLAVQKYFDGPHIPDPGECRSHLIDGSIIIQETNVIKWKLPTTDVQYMGNFQFLLGDSSRVRLNTNNIPCELYRIYEISPRWEILRVRYDRQTASTAREFAIFKRSCEAIEQCIRQQQITQTQENDDEKIDERQDDDDEKIDERQHSAGRSCSSADLLADYIIPYLNEVGKTNLDCNPDDIIKLYLESLHI